MQNNYISFLEVNKLLLIQISIILCCTNYYSYSLLFGSPIIIRYRPSPGYRIIRFIQSISGTSLVLYICYHVQPIIIRNKPSPVHSIIRFNQSIYKRSLVLYICYQVQPINIRYKPSPLHCVIRFHQSMAT